jgi:plastocyanin
MGTPARRLSTLIAIVATTVALAACSSGTTTTAITPPAPAATAPATPATTITATNFDFGAPITVSPGAVVTFVNNDETRHNVTADQDKAFASPTVVKGTTTFTAPTTPGSYPFHCTFHTVMHGTLIVR